MRRQQWSCRPDTVLGLRERPSWPRVAESRQLDDIRTCSPGRRAPAFPLSIAISAKPLLPTRSVPGLDRGPRCGAAERGRVGPTATDVRTSHQKRDGRGRDPAPVRSPRSLSGGGGIECADPKPLTCDDAQPNRSTTRFRPRSQDFTLTPCGLRPHGVRAPDTARGPLCGRKGRLHRSAALYHSPLGSDGALRRCSAAWVVRSFGQLSADSPGPNRTELALLLAR